MNATEPETMSSRRSPSSRTILRMLLGAGALLALPAVAQAACYEDLGTTGCPDREVFSFADLKRLSCQNLWYVRNNIYNEGGLCFKTAAAQAVFDNSDCTTDNPADIVLNSFEQKNIGRIRSVEKAKGCTR